MVFGIKSDPPFLDYNVQLYLFLTYYYNVSTKHGLMGCGNELAA